MAYSCKYAVIVVVITLSNDVSFSAEERTDSTYGKFVRSTCNIKCSHHRHVSNYVLIHNVSYVIYIYIVTYYGLRYE
jgi:hypothetical protein